MNLNVWPTQCKNALLLNMAVTNRSMKLEEVCGILMIYKCWWTRELYSDILFPITCCAKNNLELSEQERFLKVSSKRHRRAGTCNSSFTFKNQINRKRRHLFKMHNDVCASIVIGESFMDWVKLDQTVLFTFCHNVITSSDSCNVTNVAMEESFQPLAGGKFPPTYFNYISRACGGSYVCIELL